MPNLLKPTRYHLLIIAVIVQVLILGGEYLNSVYPIWIGEKVALAIRPVDPRSMFRGNYARLNYDIERLDQGLFPVDTFTKIKNGSVIYVTLEKWKDIWIPKTAQLDKPKQGIFIRGRVYRRFSRNQTSVKYGVEAYFAPPEKAKAIERDLRAAQRDRDADNPIAVAEVMIAPNGKAALLGVKIGEKMSK